MRILPMLLLLIALGPNGAAAQSRPLTQAGFTNWIDTQLWPRARAAGLSRGAFDRAMGGVRLQTELPELVVRGSDQDAQTEFRAPAAYFRPQTVAGATRGGRDMAQKHRAALRRATQATGVPGHILLAIWGRESAYGKAAIPHDAIAVLATKAYAGRRSGYFENELIAALQILANGQVTRAQMRSSWAGALGQPQFMPSSYLAFARDADGDGHANIWSSVPDTLLSIGTYLARHGWTRGRDWGFEVIVPKDVSCALEGPENGRAIDQWRAMGVRRVAGKSFPKNEVRGQGFLVMPAGRYGPAFVVTPNFSVLKQYNNSDLYALFVGHVGDRVAYGMPDFVTGWAPVVQVSRATIRKMQANLVDQGHDVGGVDGLVGTKTRRALGLWQRAHGLPVTCYPDAATLAALGR